MLLNDDNFVMQGGVRNYLGKTEEVKAPKFWKSSKDSPETELVYITEAEKGLLLDANLHNSLDNGKPNVGASGLLSLDGFGSTDSGQNRSGGDVGGGMDRGQDDGNDNYGSSSGGGASFQGSNTPDSPPGVTPNQNYTDTEIEKGIDIYGNPIKETVVESNIVEKAFDAYKKYGLIPNALKLGKLGLEKLGTYSTSLQNKAIAFDLQNKLEKAYQSPTFDPFTPDANVTQLEQDLASAKAGEFSQQEYQDRYAPQMNETDQSGGDNDRNLINQLTPYAADAVGGTTTQPSMVNDYFANMGSNLGVSSAYMDTYNAAKANITKTLNLPTNNQQYGYGNTFNQNFNRSMTSANPFFDELTNQGLI